MSEKKSTRYERELTLALRKHFTEHEVISQWRTSKDASDAFKRDKKLYAPRPDIGVGPFSITDGNKYQEIVKRFDNCTPRGLKERLRSLERNKNPRCLFSIEIACSGSTKHILGDITNASMMGLYGLVVVEKGSASESKARRVLRFLKKIKEVKLPTGPTTLPLFDNVEILGIEEILGLLV